MTYLARKRECLHVWREDRGSERKGVAYRGSDSFSTCHKSANIATILPWMRMCVSVHVVNYVLVSSVDVQVVCRDIIQSTFMVKRDIDSSDKALHACHSSNIVDTVTTTCAWGLKNSSRRISMVLARLTLNKYVSLYRYKNCSLFSYVDFTNLVHWRVFFLSYFIHCSIIWFCSFQIYKYLFLTSYIEFEF